MRLTSKALTLLGLFVALSVGVAQPPPLPSDLLEGGRTGRRITGDTIIFCVDPRDPAHTVDRAIAEELAAALLLEAEFHVIERTLVVEEFANIYVDLVDHCHVYLGFKQLSGTYADWATLTGAYYQTTYVMAVANGEWESLPDIPRSEPLATVPGTPGDLRLFSYLNTLPNDQRWPRHPRGSTQMALDAVISGSAAGALVWAPNLWRLRSDEPAYRDLTFFTVEGVSIPFGVAGVLLSGNDFLRLALDDAIQALVRSGQIEEVLDSLEFPAQPPPLR